MKEIIFWGDTIDDAVKDLLAAKDAGEHVYGYFNDVKLCSDDVTLDSAYMAICGCTKEQHEKRMQLWHEEYVARIEKEQAEAVAKIPEQIERGKKLIFPFRHEKWEEVVEADAYGDYSGSLTECALQIMTAIEEGKTVDELMEIFKEQYHSGRTAFLTSKAVLQFSKYGIPFYRAYRKGILNDAECTYILRLIRENIELSGDPDYANNIAEITKEIASTAIKNDLDHKRYHR